MSWINGRKYAAINPLIRESYARKSPPFAQGQRLHGIAYGSMFIQPNDSPHPAQFLTAYTQPLQQFYQTNTFNSPAGDVSPGRRLSQPNGRFAAPSQLPVPTNMPWDL